MPNPYQPRFLIQYADNQKKRFMSPNQMKLYPNNNQQSKNLQFTQVQKVYSPQSKMSYESLNNQPVPKGATKQSVQQILQQNKKVESKSKQKSGPEVLKQKPVKDYMMTNLAKLNYKKKDQELTSRSRSKNKIQNQKSKQKQNSEHNQEYGKSSLYNNKQKQIQRRTKKQYSSSSNNESQSQSTIQQSESSIKNTSNQFLNYSKFPESKIQEQQVRKQIRQMQPQKQKVSFKEYTNEFQESKVFQNRSRSKDKRQMHNYKQEGIELIKKNQIKLIVVQQKYQYKSTPKQYTHDFYQEKQKNRYQQQVSMQDQHKSRMNRNNNGFLQQKNSRYNNMDNYQQSGRQNQLFYRQSQKNVGKSQINNSQSLIQHLHKAHDQKQQIRIKLFQTNKQNKQLKQQLENKNAFIMELKAKFQQSKSQAHVLQTQLKKYVDLEKNAKQSLQFSNTKNQEVYRQIHSKYQNILQSNRDLHTQVTNLTHQLHNFQQKNTSLQAKIRYLQDFKKRQQSELQKNQEIHVKQIRNIQASWKQKVNRLQSQLIQNNNSLKTGPSANFTIKIMELQSINLQKQKLLKQKQEQIRQQRDQMNNKISKLEDLVNKKQIQINQQRKDYQTLKRKTMTDMQESQQKNKKTEIKLIERERYIAQLKMKLEIDKADHKQTGFNLRAFQSNDVRQSNQASLAISNIVTNQTNDTNKLRQELYEKVQKNYKLQTEMEQYKVQVKNLQQQLNISRLMLTSAEKKNKQTGNIQLASLKSQIQSNHSKIKSIQQKLSVKTNQIKQKDQFIQNYLVRMTNQQSIPDVLSQLNKILHSF